MGGPLKTKSVVDRLLKYWAPIVKFVSCEWLLTSTRHPNGGDIIGLRALLTAFWIYSVIFLLKLFLDSWTELFGELKLFGAIFAATYVALYARFASQWTYLANLYNQIKATEARTARDDDEASKSIIAAWKAGFLEDAEELHLATKGVFVSVLKIWGDDDAVRKCFIKNTPGGEKRFDALMGDVKNAYERHERRFSRTGE